MIKAFARQSGRIAGLSAFTLACFFIVSFVGLLMASQLLAAYDDKDGLNKTLCLVGIQASEKPCPQTAKRLSDAEHARDDAERLRAELQAKLARIKALEDATDKYTLFSTRNPPAFPGVSVVTGSVYDSLLERGEPDEYCYVSRVDSNDVMQRVQLTDGDRTGLKWSRLTNEMAAPVGLTLDQLTAARVFCKFIGKAPANG